MSLGAHASIGRRMAISGLLFFAWITFEMKRPATYTEENWVVVLINKYYNHEYVILIFGNDTKYYTVHQVAKYIAGFW